MRKYIYSRAAANGKRVQCQGGAKNHAIVLPDANLDTATAVVGESAFACAGQRCLAVSVAVTVGEAQKKFRDSITDRLPPSRWATAWTKACAWVPSSRLTAARASKASSPRAPAKGRPSCTTAAAQESRSTSPGNFVGPTVIDGVRPASELAATEIFGPVLSLVHADTLEEAIRIISQSEYGNAASLFTTNGATARRFRYEAPAGNIGINIGVAAPMAYFPFSGWKASFFGDLHAQGRDAIEFYTEKKVVIERWA